jgi:predicted transposase/invertase (TIGR01784 family)
MKAKRTYRDSLFRKYFNDKRRLLSLYNALEGTDYTNPREIKITTLKGVFFNDFKNDISFQIKDEYIVLLEHQSTPNANMPLRCLFYINNLYRNYVNPELIYKEKLVKIPTPKFFVFYNGEKDEPDKQLMKLSDAFTNENGGMELEVTAYNINYARNKALLEKCQSLKEYSIFVEQVKQNMQTGDRLKKAVEKAIAYCMEHNVMEKFIKEYGKEMYDMVNMKWDIRTAKKVWCEEAREEGREKGREEGREANRLEMAVGMLKEKLPIEMVARITKLSLETLKELAVQNKLV